MLLLALPCQMLAAILRHDMPPLYAICHAADADACCCRFRFFADVAAPARRRKSYFDAPLILQRRCCHFRYSPLILFRQSHYADYFSPCCHTLRYAAYYYITHTATHTTPCHAAAIIFRQSAITAPPCLRHFSLRPCLPFTLFSCYAAMLILVSPCSCYY